MNTTDVLRIVAIDDNPRDLVMIAQALAPYIDVNIIPFTDLESAIGYTCLHGVDLILLDYTLPSVSGLEATRQLHAKLGKEIPLVVVTPDEDVEVFRQLIKAGAQDCLCKDSLDGRNLFRCIHNALERQELQQQLQHAALSDSLTGLPNRDAIFAEISSQLLTQSSFEPFSVLFLDIDDFKLVNDSHGHDFGDKFLIEFVQRVKSCLRPQDSFARFGGDEFVLLLPGEICEDAVQAIADSVRKSFEAPILIEGTPVFTGVSMGYSAATAGHNSASQLLQEADTALFAAKARGKSRCVKFDIEMRDAALEALTFERALWQAAGNKELELHYQPLVNIQDGRVTGFETLVRWRQAGNLVSPLRFISIAEKTGAIHQLGFWILESACQQLQAWAKVNTEISLSVNVSPVQFEQANFATRVLDVIDQHELEPQRLTIELTESGAIKDFTRTVAMLAELREKGVRISIDDFGTGHSSLSHLHRLPVDEVKIDRSFIQHIESAEDYSSLFVETIHLLASRIGLDIIAEGIETQGQRAKLLSCGYLRGQGYLFARPLTVAEATELLIANRSLDSLVTV